MFCDLFAPKSFFIYIQLILFFGVEVSCEEHLEAIWDNLVEIYLSLRRGLSGTLFILQSNKKKTNENNDFQLFVKMCANYGAIVIPSYCGKICLI